MSIDNELVDRVLAANGGRAETLRLLAEAHLAITTDDAIGEQASDLIEDDRLLEAALLLKHPHDLWCVGDMEEGPFARIVAAMPDGSYSGGEITVQAHSIENALIAAFLRAATLRALTQKDT